MHDDRARLRPSRWSALRFFNGLWAAPGAVEPVHRRAGDLCRAAAERERPPEFEDGLQRRDFVSVYDIARACRLALEKPQLRRARFSTSAVANPAPWSDIARQLAACDGKDHLTREIRREVPRRRHPPLLCGISARRAQCLATNPG